jgi:hypothetical protein
MNIKNSLLSAGSIYALIIIVLPGLIFVHHGHGFGIVNNSSSSVSPEDSICIPFFNLDSLGRNIGGLDTAKIMVFNPGGDSVFCESVTGIAGRIKIGVDNGDTSYRWAAQVSDIDGNGQYGQYIVKITAKSDQSGAWLKTPILSGFQLISKEFDDAMASEIDSTKKTLDSLYIALARTKSILDSLQSQDNWVMAKNDSVIIDRSSNLSFADTIANRVLEDSMHYWGIGNGGGIYSHQLFVIDSSLEQAIPMAGIEIHNIEQTSLIALGQTNSLGYSNFNLLEDSFLVNVFAAGYIFDGFDTLIVSGSGVDTIFGFHFMPENPASPDLCRLYGFLYDISRLPSVSATVTAYLPAGVVRSGGGIISPYKKTTATDTLGYFFIDLIPNNDLIPDTTKYEIIITLSNGTILRERIVIPDMPSWQLSW